MNQEELKQKRLDYIMEVIFKYTTTEPKLTEREIAMAILFHLESDELIKALKKEAKSKW
jgi:hypothetical protein